jgi:hypothetical protein
MNTKYLNICRKCTSITWSKRFINSLEFENTTYRAAISEVLSNVNFIFDENLKFYAQQNWTFIHDGSRARLAYSILLDGSWVKNGISYDYYVGGTGLHPAIRYLQHLMPRYEDGDRSKSMKHMEEFIFEYGGNDQIQYKLESQLAKKFCEREFYVYSDMHDCKKCKTP